MNYVPFAFVEAIHEEKIERSRTYLRRRNDGFMPQPALMPDPIGLLFSQIHSAIDWVATRAIQGIFHAAPTGKESETSNLTVALKQQPRISEVTKQSTHKAVITEMEKNNDNGYPSRRIYV